MADYIDKTKGLNIRTAVISVMLITVVTKILSFARDFFLSFYLGAGNISDAYLISQTIPGTIFQFVGNGLTTCFIPVFVSLTDKKEREKNYFTNSVISLILLFSSVIMLTVWTNGETIVKLFASGFNGRTLEKAVLFTKISVSSLYLSAFIYVFNSLLQANNCFMQTSLSAIPNAILILVSIVLGAKIDILLLPIGSVAAIAFQLIFLIPSVRNYHFKLDLNLDFKSKEMKDMYRLLLPVVVGVSVNEINVLVDKTLASRIAVGGISSLNYAYSLIMFVQGIFAQTIATVYYPSITRYAKEKKKEEFQKSIEEAVEGILFFLLPITAGCVLLAPSAVRILYGRGAFDSQAIVMTASALTGYGIGCVGYGIREIFSRVFYSMNQTKVPTRNAIIGMLVNIGMNITLSKPLGIAGLALATSFSSIITSLLLLYDLKREKIFTLNKRLRTSFLKMLIAAVGMGSVVGIFHKALSGINEIIGLTILIMIGGISYIFLCFLFRLDMLKTAIIGIKYKYKICK